MKRSQKIIMITMAVLLSIKSTAFGQIPVELFAGNEKSTIDIMFFKFFKNKHGQNSEFLFFNRNRASVDYRMTSDRYLPSFGFTEAISYNNIKFKGFAPVAVIQFLNSGITPKAGIQYAKITGNMTLFSWYVSEMKNTPKTDFFVLLRYTDKLTDKTQFFSQIESLNVLPVNSMDNLNFIQRFRLGLKFKSFQTGLGLDMSEYGRKTFVNTSNFGVFIRNEF